MATLSFDNLISFSNLSNVLAELHRMVKATNMKVEELDKRVSTHLKSNSVWEQRLIDLESGISKLVERANITEQLGKKNMEISQLNAESVAHLETKQSVLSGELNKMQSRLKSVEEGFRVHNGELQEIQTDLKTKANFLAVEEVKNLLNKQFLEASLRQQEKNVSIDQSLTTLDGNKADKQFTEHALQVLGEEISQQLAMTNEQLNKLQQISKDKASNETVKQLERNMYSLFGEEEGTLIGKAHYRCLACDRIRPKMSGSPFDHTWTDPDFRKSLGSPPAEISGTVTTLMGTDGSYYKGRVEVPEQSSTVKSRPSSAKISNNNNSSTRKSQTTSQKRPMSANVT